MRTEKRLLISDENVWVIQVSQSVANLWEENEIGDIIIDSYFVADFFYVKMIFLVILMLLFAVALLRN